MHVPAQEPTASSGLQDMMDLLLPLVVQTVGHNVPSQKLSRPRNICRGSAKSSASAAAGAGRFGAEQQQGELPAGSQQPDLQKPRPKPSTGPASSCVPAAAPREELSPEHECVVCLNARRCVMVAPCGHIPYCVECAEQLCGPDGIHALTRGQSAQSARQKCMQLSPRHFTERHTADSHCETCRHQLEH